MIPEMVTAEAIGSLTEIGTGTGIADVALPGNGQRTNSRAAYQRA